MTTIKIPKRFYIDHVERDLPAPDVVRDTKRHFWIDAESEHLSDLLSDATYYAFHMDAGPDGYLVGIIRSAAATKKAIEAHLSAQ